VQDFPLQASAFLILFARAGAVLMLLPLFSEESVPGRIRLLIAFGLSLGLWGLLSPAVLGGRCDRQNRCGGKKEGAAKGNAARRLAMHDGGLRKTSRGTRQL
jgi:hypothetical protein